MANKKIPGIFNYCDRWCERCTFTARCTLYEEESNSGPDEPGPKDEVLLKHVQQNLAKAKAMLEQAARERGFDLETVREETEASEKREEVIRNESRAHPLSVLTLEYATLARNWLNTQPGMLERLEKLKTEINLGIEPHEAAKRETQMIRDSLAVIEWYMGFIHVKLMRALIGKRSSEDDEWDEDEDFQQDYNGSAKVAMIAIERSREAWSALFRILPEKEDDFLRILALLEKVKKSAQEEFPDAQRFIRPGFDEH